MTAADRNLYVGTQCGLIIYYHVEEAKSPLGKVLYQSKVKGRIQLGADKRKAIQQLTVVPSQKRLVALVDGELKRNSLSTPIVSCVDSLYYRCACRFTVRDALQHTGAVRHRTTDLQGEAVPTNCCHGNVEC